MSKRLLALCGFLLFIAWLEIRRLRTYEHRWMALEDAGHGYLAEDERWESQFTPEEYVEREFRISDSMAKLSGLDAQFDAEMLHKGDKS